MGQSGLLIFSYKLNVFIATSRRLAADNIKGYFLPYITNPILNKDGILNMLRRRLLTAVNATIITSYKSERVLQSCYLMYCN